MSLLRDGDSINFQKASCTLDGCVKIYTSRVDSVASETGKLLSGLSDSRTPPIQQPFVNGIESKRAQEAEEGDEEGADTEEQREKKARKRAQRAEATLVKDFNAIQLKKFDLEFSVDPLFKKTSADFDEGGAKGLLLNHLNLDKDGRIVFDASDTLLEEDDEDEPSTQEGSLGLDLADLQGFSTPSPMFSFADDRPILSRLDRVGGIGRLSLPQKL
jgi:condensin complex subunit 2